jgi:leader peptidase (prepilin peptidase)/N-methyltransferase
MDILKRESAGYGLMASILRKVFGKTVGRTIRFFVEALARRRPWRQYTPIAWSLVAGLLVLLARICGLPGDPAALLSSFYLLMVLAAVCAIDARYSIIPDSIVAVLAVGGLLQHVQGGASEIWQSLVEALILFGVAWAFQAIYRAIRGFDGLGFGDVKFTTAAVLWIGIAAIPGLLLIAVVSAFISLLILKREGVALGRSKSIPFGPHLAIGLWLSWLTGIVLYGFDRQTGGF